MSFDAKRLDDQTLHKHHINEKRFSFQSLVPLRYYSNLKHVLKQNLNSSLFTIDFNQNGRILWLFSVISVNSSQ
jgi:hypothetical protein